MFISILNNTCKASVPREICNSLIQTAAFCSNCPLLAEQLIIEMTILTEVPLAYKYL